MKRRVGRGGLGDAGSGGRCCDGRRQSHASAGALTGFPGRHSRPRMLVQSGAAILCSAPARAWLWLLLHYSQPECRLETSMTYTIKGGAEGPSGGTEAQGRPGRAGRWRQRPSVTWHDGPLTLAHPLGIPGPSYAIAIQAVFPFITSPPPPRPASQPPPAAFTGATSPGPTDLFSSPLSSPPSSPLPSSSSPDILLCCTSACFDLPA